MLQKIAGDQMPVHPKIIKEAVAIMAELYGTVCALVSEMDESRANDVETSGFTDLFDKIAPDGKWTVSKTLELIDKGCDDLKRIIAEYQNS